MQALLVDLDGTLADSLPVLRVVFDRFVRDLGGSEHDYPFDRFNGPPLDQIVAVLQRELAPARSAADLLDDYRSAVDEAYPTTRPNAGAADFLAHAKAVGKTLIVVTSNDRARTLAWLGSTGLAGLVDGLVCGGETARGKPWPDPYLAGLRLAGVRPEDAVAIEDSLQGAQAARAAGVPTIVYRPDGQPACEWPEGTTVCRGFAEIGQLVLGLDTRSGERQNQAMPDHNGSCTPFAIDGRLIGPGQPPYIIAELSANHLGRIETALDLIEAAARAGAHAVKLQTYTADTMTLDHDGPDFVIRTGPWQGRRLYELYDEAHTPWEWFPTLFAKARACGIACFSSPFDESAVDMLECLDAPAYKIASFEMIDHPLIERAARTGKPMIMSRGMATAEEIAEAVSVARAAGCRDLLLLHCVSGYPAPADEINLASIPDLRQRFGTMVGLSDHTLGNAVAVAAVALGAVAVEKHFIRQRSDGGPDAAFSIEPPELADLVEGTLTAWKALGEPSYSRKDSEAGQIQLRRSLYIAADVKAGEALTAANLRSIRPGFGLSPKHYQAVLGRTAARDLPRGTPLAWKDLV